MTDTARAAFAAKYPALDAEVSLGENNPDYRGIEDIRGRHALNYFRAGWQAAIVSREADARILQLKAAGTLANNLCPDHRDKQVGRPCLACEIERKDKEIAQLREDARNVERKTAERCREMALWPQGIDDEQAYYGRMFAEFIEKEFKLAAIDQEKPKC